MSMGTKLILAMVILMAGGFIVSIVGDILIGREIDTMRLINSTRTLDTKIVQLWESLTSYLKNIF